AGNCAHSPAAPSGSPTAASCAARPARQSPATRRASRTAVPRSAPSHRRCGPQPSARVVTEDTVLRASHGPDRRRLFHYITAGTRAFSHAVPVTRRHTVDGITLRPAFEPGLLE